MAKKKTSAGNSAPPKGRPRQGVPATKKGTDEAMFAEHLLSLAQTAGVTSEEIAEALGLTVQAVNKYFSAARIPHFKDWRSLATVLKLRHVNDLLPNMPIGRR